MDATALQGGAQLLFAKVSQVSARCADVHIVIYYMCPNSILHTKSKQGLFCILTGNVAKVSIPRKVSMHIENA